MTIKFSPPDITEQEIAEVVDTLRSGWITTGPKTKKFEEKLREYVNAERIVCLNSATASMELGLRLFGIGEGDEVITSSYTYTASASVIDHVGAKIVLCDIQKDSLEMDYEQLKKLINKNTKAIIPIDVAGIPCDYDKIMEIVNEKKDIFEPKNSYQEDLGRILVLSDSAHSFAGKYKGKNVCEVADITCYSFHAVKNLTTSEGGAIAIRRGLMDPDEFYEKIQHFSLHGQSKDALSKTRIGSWEYDILGTYYKCNMTDIVSSIGLVQLDRFKGLEKRREEIVKKYNKNFEGSKVAALNHFLEDRTSTYHLYIANIEGVNEKERNRVIEELAKKDIAANVHYKPLPLLTAYKNLGFDIKDFPNAMSRYKSEITLPLHTLLTDEDVDLVSKELIKIVG